MADAAKGLNNSLFLKVLQNVHRVVKSFVEYSVIDVLFPFEISECFLKLQGQLLRIEQVQGTINVAPKVRLHWTFLFLPVSKCVEQILESIFDPLDIFC